MALETITLYITVLKYCISVVCFLLTAQSRQVKSAQDFLNQSWINPAEWVMSLSNLPLQNYALGNDSVETTNLENMLANVTIMNQRRTLSKRIKYFKRNFLRSCNE